jgi:hypothetical protein
LELEVRDLKLENRLLKRELEQRETDASMDARLRALEERNRSDGIDRSRASGSPPPLELADQHEHQSAAADQP